jgi:hypothetical protein
MSVAISCSLSTGCAAASTTHLCVFDGRALYTAHGACRPHARSYPPFVSGVVQRQIYDASLTFRVNYLEMLSIAQCESSLNPSASNGVDVGLYQFEPGTFSRAASQMRSQAGVSASSPWRGLDAAYTAAFLISQGDRSTWGC